MVDLTFLLPAYNEELSIGPTIDEIRTLFHPSKILVIDNGSMDGTFREAWLRGVDVVKESKKGKGNAVRTGIKLVQTEYCIMLDSDFTYPINDCLHVYEFLKDKGYGVVLGTRDYRWSSSMSLLNRIGNTGLSLLASLLYRRRIRDVCSGLWGFRRDVLQELDLVSERFTLEVDILTNVMKGRYRFTQVPIEYTPRPDGSKAKLKALMGLQIGWFLIRNRWR
jgi:dolichol-phosphate mannosyltransferase